MRKRNIFIITLLVVCLIGFSAYAGINDELVGHWNFDEGEGTVLHDLSGNNYDGTIVGGATWSDGICGGALNFDGVDDYVILPDIDLVPDPFTICAWVKIQDNTLPGSHRILSRTHGNVPGEYNFAFYPNYVLYLDVVRETGIFRKAYEAAWTNEPSPLGWHFYCGSWDSVERCDNYGDGIKLYIDGILQTNFTGGGSCYLYPRTGVHLTAIGAYEGREPPSPAPRSSFAQDPMDEIRIYDRELSAGEIQELYEGGLSCLVVPVTIDIKPGSDPNCFNINGHGVIPVAILGSLDLDVSDIKTDDTLSFNGLAVRVRGKKGPLCSIEYSNGDEFLDLVCHFEDDPSEWLVDSNEKAILTGELVDGTPFEGTDSICIVP
jgi:hypothetical protein